SASHVAHGSIRMEPVFMVLGQSAATAAALAIEAGVAVQDVSYDRLRERLLADGQVLEWTGPSRRPKPEPVGSPAP
ncbi:MAG: FAD-dependent oxidoreductase, partial [Planctomycetota bacterium]